MIISILNNEILIDYFCKNIFSNTQDVLQFDVKNAYPLIHSISSSGIYLNLIQIYKTLNMLTHKIQIYSIRNCKSIPTNLN